MKIGDECWVVVNEDGQHHEVVYDNLGEAQSWCEDGDTTVRVRIVPADCTETTASADKSGGSGADDGWQTMETAPKDGTRIWLYANGRCTEGRWNDDAYSKNPRPFWDHSNSRTRSRNHPPTHWRPLPPPPETSS